MSRESLEASVTVADDIKEVAHVASPVLNLPVGVVSTFFLYNYSIFKITFRSLFPLHLS